MEDGGSKEVYNFHRSLLRVELITDSLWFIDTSTAGAVVSGAGPGRTIINKRGLGLHYLVVQRGISAGHGRL